MRRTALEGSLRDLALPDLLQLLELGRKSGTLRLLGGGGRGWITLRDGRVRDAGLHDTGAPPGAASRAAQVEACALELLTWAEGTFTFEPDADGAPDATPGDVRIGVDALLMESARRADEWARLADRVAGPHVVLALADAGAGSDAVAPTPQQWALLARADGARDVRALAGLLRRDPLLVAADAHALVRAGLLVVRSPADTDADPGVASAGAQSSLG